MKLTFLLTLFAVLQATAESFAQRITLNAENTSLLEVMHEVQRQSGYRFFLNRSDQSQVKVTAHLQNADLEETMTELLKGLPYSWTLRDRTIIIKAAARQEDRKPSQQPIYQDQEYRGTVVDGAGVPVAGVTVRVKGETSVVITNEAGNFRLKTQRENPILTFSMIGFETAEMPATANSPIRVILMEAVSDLDEVVVIGYGEVGKKDLTGSVGQVNMGDLVHAPVASFTEALAGRVAGVEVSSSDGQPGQGQQIVIRGAGSLTQSTAPLYVIDGFPIEDFDAGSLNTEDIKSISILKDASATAIYGARGANGVVVIETKGGETETPTITVNSSLGFQDIHKKLEVMDPYEFVKLQTELNLNNANLRYFQDGKTLESYRDEAGINWQDQVFDTSPQKAATVALRGRTGGTNYSITGSLFDQDGVVIHTGYSRKQGRISLEQTVNKKLRAGVTANYSHIGDFGQEASTGDGDLSTFLFYNVWGYRPISGTDDLDLLEEDYDPDFMGTSEQRTNPLKELQNTYRQRNSKQLLANAFLNYDIMPDLTLRLMAGTNNREVRTDVFNNSKTLRGNPDNPLNIRGINGAMNYLEVNTWSSENMLTYNKRINRLHRVTFMTGFSFQGRKTNSNGVSVGFVPNEELGISGLDEGTPYIARSVSSEFMLASFFGRLNYNYQSKYLLTATFRGDGSSKFAPGNKWGYFPSAAFAWNMAEENFLKNNSTISNAKLRLSYGVTGNNRVDDFAYLSTLSMPQREAYSFNNEEPTKGVIPADLGNADLKWEVSEQFDLGYDLGLFKNRIELTVDAYRKTTRDLLLNANIPGTSGFTTAFMNIGKIRNEGLEVSLNTVNVHSPTFTWETNFNISLNRNEVLELSKGEEKLFSFITMVSAYNNSPLYVAEIGQPASMFYGYIFDGVYQLEDFDNPTPDTYMLKPSVPTNGDVREQIQPGDIKYRDLNGDGVVDTYDQAVIGRALPLYAGGLRNNFRYKGFDINVFLQWAYGHEIYNANRLMMEGNGLLRNNLNQFTSYINRWTPENPTNENFRAGGQGPLGRHSSRTVEDGSYLRLKTVSLGYTLPPTISGKWHIPSIRLSLAAQNLLTWTNYSGMDPEVSVRNSVLTRGFDYSAYPRARTFVFGINLTL